MNRLLLLLLFVLPILACDLNNNDPLPTLAPTLIAPGVKVTPPTAAPAATVRPGTTQTAPPSTPRPGASLTPTPDKGDELDKLLDELNNALQNMDTLDDVK